MRAHDCRLTDCDPWRWFRCVRWIAVAVLVLPACGKPSINRNGGLVLIYQLASPDQRGSEELVPALESRLAQFGYPGATVRTLDSGQIEITIPGVDDPIKATQVKQCIATTGYLEFRIIALRGIDDAIIARAEAEPADGESAELDDALAAKWVRVDPNRVTLPADSVSRTAQDGTEVLVLDDKWDFTGQHIRSVEAGSDEQANPNISIRFSASGTERMTGLTEANLPDATGKSRQLAIILDDSLQSAPTIRAVVGERAQISGQFLREEVEFLVAVLRAGALPAKLNPKPVSERIVAPDE